MQSWQKRTQRDAHTDKRKLSHTTETGQVASKEHGTIRNRSRALYSAGAAPARRQLHNCSPASTGCPDALTHTGTQPQGTMRYAVHVHSRAVSGSATPPAGDAEGVSVAGTHGSSSLIVEAVSTQSSRGNASTARIQSKITRS